jgi:tRNA threonylcarbamoyladenosine biosynthesis protein TsaE
MIVTTRSAEETEAVGAAIGAVLGVRDLIVLGGDLGAGKTTLAKGIARGLGVADTVTSPTFTIVQEYDGPTRVAHVDIYRLRRVQELHDLALEELLDERVVLVEWGDVVAPLLPQDRLDVSLAIGDDITTRTIELVGRGARWSSRVGAIGDALASARSA